MAKPVLAALLIATGCGTTIVATMVNPSPRPLASRPPETVEVFTSGAPTRPHVDVAYLEAEQETQFSAHRTAEFFAELRTRAAGMGCDGLVIGGTTNKTTVSIDLKTSANISGLTATCIVFTEPPEPLATSTGDHVRTLP